MASVWLQALGVEDTRRSITSVMLHYNIVLYYVILYHAILYVIIIIYLEVHG